MGAWLITLSWSRQKAALRGRLPVLAVVGCCCESHALPGCAGHAPGSGCHRGGAQPLEELLVRNMAIGCREYAVLRARHVSCRSKF